jgi:hypothetical protein
MTGADLRHQVPQSLGREQQSWFRYSEGFFFRVILAL